MSHRARTSMIICSLVVFAAAVWRSAPTRAQQVVAAKTKFEFEVVESFDAKYLGDTPGHMGRGGGLAAKPAVALGDPVYRGKAKVGRVSGLVWDRTKESLQVEFDPEPFEVGPDGRPLRSLRIAVGDKLWVPLGFDDAAAEDLKKP